MEKENRLDLLRPGERGCVKRLSCDTGMRRRLIDVGLIPGTVVHCVGQSPLGDPLAYRIRGKVIAIRKRDGRKIILQ